MTEGAASAPAGPLPARQPPGYTPEGQFQHSWTPHDTPPQPWRPAEPPPDYDSVVREDHPAAAGPVIITIDGSPAERAEQAAASARTAALLLATRRAIAEAEEERKKKKAARRCYAFLASTIATIIILCIKFSIRT
ncbi:hypothetical protein ONE63_010377 [Megalurothrips usitatus]|uniref:Uncharacterized protein n=1 Tax=Megalurothrips usitatus TaxID=439358 RepID=A0AAV7XLC7_9NEOP|nr:hypothetical protein ONE63_010377 [Megalurothrips usitatus]